MFFFSSLPLILAPASVALYQRLLHPAHLTLQKFIYIYESKKIRNDARELSLSDERKRYFKLQGLGVIIGGVKKREGGLRVRAIRAGLRLSLQ